jgi:hypothetical protein
MSKILNNSIPITLFCSVFPCSYMCRYHWFGCSRFLQDVSTLCVQKIRHLKYSKSRAEVSRHRKFLLHSVCVYQTAVCHILGDHDLNLHDWGPQLSLALSLSNIVYKTSRCTSFVCLSSPSSPREREREREGGEREREKLITCIPFSSIYFVKVFVVACCHSVLHIFSKL